MSPQRQAFVFFACCAVAGLVIGVGVTIGLLRGGTWLAVCGFVGFALSCWMLLRGYRIIRSN